MEGKKALLIKKSKKKNSKKKVKSKKGTGMCGMCPKKGVKMNFWVVVLYTVRTVLPRAIY